jgi:hypothetical protein
MAVRHRLAAAVALVLATAASGVAVASPDPILIARDAVGDVQAIQDGAVRDLTGGGAFPPAGFVTTSIVWSMAPGDAAPTFTPPGPASHPLNWSCQTSTTATTAHASCTPTDPTDPGTTAWQCYDPYVVADIRANPSVKPTSSVRFPSVSVTGTARCGESVAQCTASTPVGGAVTTTGNVNAPADHCSDAAWPHQLTPLVCDADFGGAAGATWSVRCAPVDP